MLLGLRNDSVRLFPGFPGAQYQPADSLCNRCRHLPFVSASDYWHSARAVAARRRIWRAPTRTNRANVFRQLKMGADRPPDIPRQPKAVIFDIGRVIVRL